MKQMAAISAIRNHSVEGFWSSFPDGERKKSELESAINLQHDEMQSPESLGLSRRC